MNSKLLQDLLAMKEKDLSVRSELVAEGTLAKAEYHPRMEAVHKENAERLVTIIDKYGWPGQGLVGEDGAEAAWLVLQHAIGNPGLQRRGLALLKQAADQNEIPRWQPAMLEDRICMFEGKPQIYGSQFRADKNGELVPYPIQDPDGVDERRRAVGLDTLQERMAQLRKQASEEKIPSPEDLEEFEKQYEAWIRSVGWRK